MAAPRHRFTIRSLMIAVAVIAGLFAVVLNHRELLPLLIIAGIPLGGLIGLLRRVPPDRPGWRLGVKAAMLGWLIIAAGWLWARSVTWWLPHRDGLHAVGVSSYAYYNDFWWLRVPLGVTAFCLVAHVLGLARFCRRRRQYLGCLFLAGYAAALAIASVLLLVALELEVIFE